MYIKIKPVTSDIRSYIKAYQCSLARYLTRLASFEKEHKCSLRVYGRNPLFNISKPRQNWRLPIEGTSSPKLSSAIGLQWLLMYATLEEAKTLLRKQLAIPANLYPLEILIDDTEPILTIPIIDSKLVWTPKWAFVQIHNY